MMIVEYCQDPFGFKLSSKLIDHRTYEFLVK